MATVTARPADFAVPVGAIGRAHALWTTIRRKPLGAVSAAVLVTLVLTAIFADVLAPFDLVETRPEIRLQAPS